MNGAELRAWRKRNKMTQEALRIELDVSRQTIVAWEALEKDIPRVIQLALVALEKVKGCRIVEGQRQTAAQHLEQRARAAHITP
jgi:DNA-binding XRE family transcriptional regulator